MEDRPPYEKILVHEGVQLFKESYWTAITDHVGVKVFLLAGIREKEVLAALQTDQKTL